MAAFHKPKLFRSHMGCCICKAKSSSSRFTSSSKYEKYFTNCFKLSEARQGEVCNACVLVVKRWRNLPLNSTKHWNHVVDARNGPGIKNVPRYRSEPTETEFQKIRKKHVKKRKQKNPSQINQDKEPVSGFIDLSYWTRKEVCCGVIFIGQMGEVMLDINKYQKCSDKASDVTSSCSNNSVNNIINSTAVSSSTVNNSEYVKDDAMFSEYSDSDSLQSKDDLLEIREIHDTDTDEGFCDNRIRST